MINEIQFSNRFSSIWSEMAPTMEHFVRSVNLGLYERYVPELDPESEGTDRALISETSFVIATEVIAGSISTNFDEISDEMLEGYTAHASSRLSQLGGFSSDIRTEPSTMRREIIELSRRILLFLRIEVQVRKIDSSPKFRGCGFLDTCFGDFVADKIIVEIKNVDRGFRSNDFKQTLTYAFLNYYSRDFDIDSICLLNARRGVYWKGSIEEAIYNCSAAPANEFMDRLRYVVTSGDLSR